MVGHRSAIAKAMLCALGAWSLVSFPARAQQTPPSGPSPTPPAQPAQDDQRKNQLKILARDAKEWVDWRRHDAWEKLLELGDNGKAVLRPIVTAKLEKDRPALEEKFKGTELAHARKKVEDALVERRKEAVACIYDKTRYPEENHGIVGQPEVDRLVDRVRVVWDHPATFTRQLTPDVETLAAALEEDVVYLEACGGKPPDDMPTVAAWLDKFNAAFDREKLGINDTQHDWNVAVAKYHADELLTSADAEELACMNATNAYRLMMGARLLEIDERLVRAGRKHSQEMKELHYFEHSSPVPENANPGLRCTHEGYSGYGGENIAGAGNGFEAFNGWYHSSGHHRNLLGGHQQFGVGRAGELPGELFTQDFGSGSSLRGRHIDDPTILYLGMLKKLDPTSSDSELELAIWCHANKLEDLMRMHAQRALILDETNSKARELLRGETRRN
jgi:hypothetical protein